MKLTDLDARFVTDAPNGGLGHVRDLIDAQGVVFQCPLCARGRHVEMEHGRRFVRGVHRVLVWFAGRAVTRERTPQGRWVVESGTSIEDLTITPSIHLTGDSCGWHGWVRNGDAA